MEAAGSRLIHGDVGCTNILARRAGDRPICQIDRQPFSWSLTTRRGGVTERRVQLWRPLLQRSLTAGDNLDCAALWR